MLVTDNDNRWNVVLKKIKYFSRTFPAFTSLRRQYAEELASQATPPLAVSATRAELLSQAMPPYLNLTLPCGEDVLPPSAEASNGSNAHP